MSRNLVIAIPTKFEAIELAKKLGINENKLQTKNLIEIKKNKYLIITGVGKKSATAVDIISKKIPDAEIILIGFCGCKNKEVPAGTCFLINKAIYKEQEIVCDTDNPSFKDMKQATIITINGYGTGSLVDMESFWFAQKCKELNIKFNMIRIVSDHCDMNTVTVIAIFKFIIKKIPESFNIALHKLADITQQL